MKATIKAKSLANAVKAVSKAIDSKSTSALLEMTFLEVRGGKLIISAQGITNALSMSVTLPCQGGEEGIIAVDGKTLSQLCSSLGEGKVTIISEEKEGEEPICMVNYSGGKLGIPCVGKKAIEEDRPKDIADWNSDKAVVLSMNASMLAEGIGAVSYAMSTDSNRPVINSICLSAEKDKTHFVATNLQILAVRTYPEGVTEFPEGVDMVEMILPTPLVKMLSVVPKNDELSLEVRFLPDLNISFAWGNVTIKAKAIQGQYPKWRTILPKEKDAKGVLTFDKGAVSSAVSRIALASSASNHVLLSMKEDITCQALSIEGYDLAFGTYAKETIGGTEYKGEEMSIGLKSGLLTSALAHIASPDGEVKFHFQDPRRSTLLTADAEEGEPSDKVIIMPINIVSYEDAKKKEEEERRKKAEEEERKRAEMAKKESEKKEEVEEEDEDADVDIAEDDTEKEVEEEVYAEV